MHCHLVTVKVCVERCTNQRMQLDCTTLNQYRHKCLNTESMQCRRTVEQYGVILDNFFKSIPYSRILSLLYHLSCTLYIVSDTTLVKLLHYKGLEQLDSHFFRKTALIHLKIRTNYDNRTS